MLTKSSTQLLVCKVIHIIPHDGVGGVEVAARSMLSSDHLNNNFKIFLIAGPSLSDMRENIIESPYRSANNPLAHFRAIYKIYRKSPDVLVCSLWRSIPIGVFVKILRPNIKLVFFLHLPSTVHLLDKYLQKIMLRYCDAIWADSQATLSTRVSSYRSYRTSIISFVTHKPTKLKVIKKPSPYFVFWGRLHKQKGVDRAIRLIKKLVLNGYNCKYDIWGRDDGERENLVNLVDTLKLSNHVKFKGPAVYSELQVIAAQHCFYLQLSREEGMAMSILEAMQFGLVPIVTPVGEIKRYCVHGENAIVINETRKLINAITFIDSILRDEESFNTLQNNAIEVWKETNLYDEDFIFAANQL